MKTLALLLIVPAMTLCLNVGCSHEVSHTESSEPHMLDNGQTTKEQTTVQNPDGSISTEQSKTVTH
jgi:hypothetical protein